jgi:glutaredoxin
MRVITLILLVIASCLTLNADTIYLKDGGTVNGIIKSRDSTGVVIKVSVGEMNISNDEIDSIFFADERQKEKLRLQWKENKSNYVKKREKAIASQKSRIKLKPVKIYVTEWCGYCRKLEKLLDLSNIEYEACDIEKLESCKNEYLYYGQGYTGVPLSVVGNVVIRGYDPGKIQKALQDPSAWKTY